MGEMQETVIATYAHTIWNQKDMGIVSQTFHEKALIHTPLGEFQGVKGMQQFAVLWLEAFPDMEVVPFDTLVEGTKVVIQWEAQGTHNGNFLNLSPTGQKVHYKGITVYRFDQLKVVEYWTYVDLHSLVKN